MQPYLRPAFEQKNGGDENAIHDDRQVQQGL